MKKLAVLFALGLGAAACGDDGGSTPGVDGGPDAAPAGACGTPKTTLSTYPATYSDNTVGAGAHLSAAEGSCLDEQGWFGDDGEDQVIELTGLTAGMHYLVELGTDQDLSFYVATGCVGASPASGACLTHVDNQFTTEFGEFDAPASGTAYLVIDSPETELTDGAYTVSVYTAECNDDVQCTGAGESQCVNQRCVGCETSFDCASATPVCEALAHTCSAGFSTCTGDDAGEPDDGPLAAHALAYPTAVTPTTTSAALCSSPAAERDWYQFVANAPGSVRIALSWTATADFDFRLRDETGALVRSGLSEEATSEVALAVLPTAGTYYLEVNRYAPAATAESTPYTLTLSLPECESSFDCTTAGRPLCDAGGACVAGVQACTNDDAAEPDDGPAAARTLNGAVGVATSLSGAVCNSPDGEADYYRFDATAGEGVTFSLAWDGTTGSDLDLYVFDATGELVGQTFWKNPETVTLTYLPAGAYYATVVLFSEDPIDAATTYTISATRTATQTCTTPTDCATSYGTQVYRGDCTGGTCHFIAPGTRASGTACDSGDDCMSSECSYLLFEADAQLSVCTNLCETSAECSALGSTYACTAGFQNNFCTSKCTNELQCGANVGSNTLTSGQPWDYLTCEPTTGVCAAP